MTERELVIHKERMLEFCQRKRKLSLLEQAIEDLVDYYDAEKRNMSANDACRFLRVINLLREEVRTNASEK